MKPDLEKIVAETSALIRSGHYYRRTNYGKKLLRDYVEEPLVIFPILALSRDLDDIGMPHKAHALAQRTIAKVGKTLSSELIPEKTALKHLSFLADLMLDYALTLHKKGKFDKAASFAHTAGQLVFGATPIKGCAAFALLHVARTLTYRDHPLSPHDNKIAFYTTLSALNICTDPQLDEERRFADRLHQALTENNVKAPTPIDWFKLVDRQVSRHKIKHATVARKIERLLNDPKTPECLRDFIKTYKPLGPQVISALNHRSQRMDKTGCNNG